VPLFVESWRADVARTIERAERSVVLIVRDLDLRCANMRGSAVSAPPTPGAELTAERSSYCPKGGIMSCALRRAIAASTGRLGASFILLGVVIALAVATGAQAADATDAAAGRTYIVLAPRGEGVAVAMARVQAANGTVVAGYAAIGVLIVRAEAANFAEAVVGPGVQSAAPTAGFGTRVGLADELLPPPAPTTVTEALWPLQWDMRAIQVAEAHSVTTGSRDVVVGVLDSGIDATHPDLASQVDPSVSASCIGGVPDSSPAAWQPTSIDHGTHVAGTVGAARNGVGIVGVAPGVRLASVKVVNDSGFIYPEAAVCGFMWAAQHGFEVTNNSYFIDPWEFNCRNDVRQRPVWVAVQRALRYARSQGVLTVASAGNSQFDLQHKFVDASSPNDGSAPVEERLINGACLDLPAEAPGVVTVSATGPTGLKSYYSNYGLGVVEVAAPGGDSRVPGTEPNGRVLSTVWPGGGWGYKQGTSMAAPHVSGVAALVLSVHRGMAPDALAAHLQRTADPQPCPAGRAYTPPGAGVVTQYCYGGTANNGFYGHGEVNAARAVTR
jgi:subtilisin family serine protease